MPLSNSDKKRYRQIGHALNPVVTVAEKGLSENINAELKRALEQHELIKVKLAVPDREAKAQLIEQICSDLGAELVQSVGHVALIYRAARKPNKKLSNIQRHKD